MITDALSQFTLLPVAKNLAMGIVLKSAVVLALAWLVSYLLRRSSAATRHAVWGAALLLLVTLPVVSVTLPPLRLEFIEEETSVVTLDRPVPVVLNAVRTAATSPQPAIASTSGTISAESTEAGSGTAGFTTVLVGVWMCGVVLIMLRLVFHLVRVNRITTRAFENQDQQITSIAAPMAKV